MRERDGLPAMLCLFLRQISRENKTESQVSEKTFVTELLCTFVLSIAKFNVYVRRPRLLCIEMKWLTPKSPIKDVKMSNLALHKIRLGLEAAERK